MTGSPSAATGPPRDEEQASVFEVVLEQEQGYRFRADFGIPGVEPLIIDEPPPLSEGAGPNAARLLAAAVGHCLSASALFCLTKARVPVHGVRTVASGRIAREENGRLRVAGIDVSIDLDVPDDARARVGRCLGLFEDFCIVTASVRRGVNVDVHVSVDGEPAAI